MQCGFVAVCNFCESCTHKKGYYRDTLEVSKYNSGSSNCPVFVLTLEQATLPGVCCFPGLTKCRGGGCRAVDAEMWVQMLWVQGYGCKTALSPPARAWNECNSETLICSTCSFSHNLVILL